MYFLNILIKGVLGSLVFSLLLLFSGCGGGSAGGGITGSSYSINSSSNNAIMGPLKNATVNIYRLSDLNKSIENTQTDDLGAFAVTLTGIPDTEMLMISVSGGEDIDADDDGILDATPTVNKGTIHGLATKADLINGKYNVTLVSEVIYKYLQKYIGDPRYTSDDIKNMVDSVTKLFVSNGDITLLAKFNPTDKPNRDKNLKFKYDTLIQGKGSLASLYHNDANASVIGHKIENLFRSLPIGIGDARLAELKKDVSVSLSASHISFHTAGINLTLKKSSDTIKKDANFTISIDSVDSGYKILNWSGCDKVSSDLQTCKIINIQSNKNIVPFVVPTETKVAAGITIRDISQAYVTIDTNSSNATITSMEVFSDIGDKNTSTIFSNMNIGDIIVHKKDPVFFGKLKTKNKINDYRYKLSIEKVPLESIITQGYIASTPVKAGTYGSTGGTRVLSRSIILPNGKKINFDPNQPSSITIDFNKGVAYATPSSRSVTPIDNGYKFDKKVLGLDVSGTITFTPNNKFGISWGFFSGLEQIYLTSGVDLKNTLNIKKTGEWKKNTHVTLANYTFEQVIAVGPIPIVLTEPIEIYLGVDGHAKASVNIGSIATVNPSFSMSWSNDSGATADFYIPHTLVNTATIDGEMDVYAYLGVYPKIEIYGIGLGIDNKFGPYFNAEGSAGAADNVIKGNVHIYAGLSGAYGLEYKGALNLTSSWDYVAKMLDKVNKKLGDIRKIDHKWQFGSFGAKTASDTNPGYVSVVGKRNVYIEKTENDLLQLSENYTLENNGGTPIYWRATLNSDPEVTAGLSEGMSSSTVNKTLTGELKAGQQTDLLVDIYKAAVELKDYNLKLSVEESSYPLYILGTPVMTSKIKVHVIPEVLTFAKTPLDASLSGTTVKKIDFNWVKQSDYDSLDGYLVYKADYNKTTDKCIDFAPFLEQKTASATSVKSDDLLTLEKKKYVQVGKEYCFMLTGYKKYKTISGEYLNREYTLTDKPAKLIPLPKTEAIVDVNGTKTSFTKELDMMFIVDVSGSYGSDIATFKSKSLDIIHSIQSKLPKDMVLKTGLSSFSDYPSMGGGGDDYAYRLDENLTYDVNGSKFQSAMNTLNLLNGGDIPESQLEALYQSITAKKIGWSPSATKLILLFTDASFHDKDRDSSYPGHGSSAVKDALTKNNISVIGLGSGYVSADLSNISSSTFLLDSSSSQVVNSIVSIIEAIPGSSISSRSIDRSAIDTVPLYSPDYIGPEN